MSVVQNAELSDEVLALVRSFLTAPNRLDPNRVAEHGMVLVILDDPFYVDPKVAELNAAVRRLGHEHYCSLDTWKLGTSTKRPKVTIHDARHDEWSGFNDYSGSGLSLRTTDTLFFTVPVSFLLLRGPGVAPVWLCGPEALIRSVLELAPAEPIPVAVGSFSWLPDVAEAVEVNRLARERG